MLCFYSLDRSVRPLEFVSSMELTITNIKNPLEEASHPSHMLGLVGLVGPSRHHLWSVGCWVAPCPNMMYDALDWISLIWLASLLKIILHMILFCSMFVSLFLTSGFIQIMNYQNSRKILESKLYSKFGYRYIIEVDNYFCYLRFINKGCGLYRLQIWGRQGGFSPMGWGTRSCWLEACACWPHH